LISVVSFNGHEINDGLVYSAYPLLGDKFFARKWKAKQHRRLDRYPSHQRVDRVGVTVPLRVMIVGLGSHDNISEALDELNGWVELGVEGELVVSFEGSQRKVTAVVTGVIPQDGAPNLYTVMFTVADPRWRSERGVLYDNGGVSCNGDNLITDSERTVGDEGDGIPVLAQGSTGIYPAATNMAHNSSGETDSTGWGTLGSTSPVRSVVEQLFGTASVKGTYSTSVTILTYESGGVGVGNTFTAGKFYYASAWVLLGSGWNGGDIRIQQYRMDAETSAAEYFDGQAAHTGGSNWQFVQTIWQQDTTVSGGVRFKALGSPSGPGVILYVDSLVIQEFDSKAEMFFSPHILTDGASDTHTYGLCTADASNYSTSQGWFMARIRGGWQVGWAADRTRKHTVFSHYDDASNYIHCYWQESAGAGAFVIERMNGGVLDTHMVNKTMVMDTLQSERPFATVCFKWTNGLLSISKNGAAFVDSGATSTNGIPAIVNPLVEVGSMNEADQLCGDIVWAAAGSGTMDNTEVNSLYNGGSDALPTVFAGAGAQFFAWDANDSTVGDNVSEFSVYNNGNIDEDEAVITLKPVTQKNAADSYQYCFDIVLANRVPRAYSNYAIDLFDARVTPSGGLDTAALVSAGKVQADGDDFRVFIDSEEAPRWFGTAANHDFNSQYTQVWVNFELEPAKEAILDGAIDNSQTTITVTKGDTSPFPSFGFLVIESECIEYTGKTQSTFTGCVRASRGTSAASHADGLSCYWVEKKIQCVYGHTAATAPDARDDRKPMFDFDDSFNDHLVWTSFWKTYDTLGIYPLRSMQWLRVMREVEALQSKFTVEDAGGSAMFWRFRQEGPGPGELPGNAFVFVLPTGSGTDGSGNYVQVTGDSNHTTKLVLFGIDENGSRRQVAPYVPATGPDPGVIQQFASVGLDMVTVELVGTVGRVAGSPIESKVGTNKVTLSETDSHRQPFIVPNSRIIGPDTIAGVMLNIKIGSGGDTFNIDLTVYIEKEDPELPGTYISLGSKTYTRGVAAQSAPAYDDYYFMFDTPISVLPGDELQLRFEYTVRNSGTVTGGVKWSGSVTSYNGALDVRDFWIFSDTLDHDGIASFPPDGEGAGVDDINIWVNDSNAPVLIQGSEASCYFLNGTLTNTTTGKSVFIEAIVTLLDEVVVNVGTGAVNNDTTGENLSSRATFSDDDELIKLLPGENAFEYTETGLQSVSVKVEYDHVWQ